MPTKGTTWAEPGRSAHGPRLHLSPSNRTRETERSATMVQVFIRHKVKDYGTWRKVFDGFAAKRREGGEVAFKIAGVSGEPNNLCLFFEWQSVAKAKEFLGSADLAREMERAGVTEKPEIYIAEELASGKL